MRFRRAYHWGMRTRVVSLRVAALLLLSAPILPGCQPSVNNSDGATPTPPASPTPTPPAPGIHISSDATWSGAYAMTDDVTVDPGVTLTIASNSTITVTSGKTLNVSGTLLVQGVATGSSVPTIFEPTAGTWGGISVLSGGVAYITNAEIRTAGVGFHAATGALLSKLIKVKFSANSQPFNLSASTKFCRGLITDGSGGSTVNAGTLTFVDTDFTAGSGADAFVYGGTAQLVFSHVHEGTSWGCLVHGGGSGTSATIDKSSFDNGSHVAFMLYTGSTATIHTSTIDVPTVIVTDGAAGNTVDASGNYWGGASGYSGPALPAGWTVTPFENSASNANVADAGPRPAGTGCEVDPSF